jgi:mannose-6-phosphate isomerase-like protein (cupin superfamily)
VAGKASIARLGETLGLVSPGHPFHVTTRNGTMFTGLYAPGDEDRQQPHEQDEVYIVARGSAALECEGEEFACTAGDVLFVPARAAHRFVRMSEDFATWAVFYGPNGGEPPAR